MGTYEARHNTSQSFTKHRKCTGKRRYSQEAATEVARRMVRQGEGDITPYECRCGWWHVGHTPWWLKGNNNGR